MQYCSNCLVYTQPSPAPSPNYRRCRRISSSSSSSSSSSISSIGGIIISSSSYRDIDEDLSENGGPSDGSSEESDDEKIDGNGFGGDVEDDSSKGKGVRAAADPDASASIPANVSATMSGSGPAAFLIGLAEMPADVVRPGARLGKGCTGEVFPLVFLHPENPEVVRACAGGRRYVVKKISEVGCCLTYTMIAA